jgi:hypothetical protein
MSKISPFAVGLPSKRGPYQEARPMVRKEPAEIGAVSSGSVRFSHARSRFAEATAVPR